MNKVYITVKAQWQRDDCLFCHEASTKQACCGSAAIRFCPKHETAAMRQAEVLDAIIMGTTNKGSVPKFLGNYNYGHSSVMDGPTILQELSTILQSHALDSLDPTNKDLHMLIGFIFNAGYNKGYMDHKSDTNAH